MFEPFSPFELIEDAQADLLRINKTNIRGILDSYHGEWDLLAEMLQNAVDALEDKLDAPNFSGNEKPRIEVQINVQAGTIRVSDNGIGMDPDMAKKILAPNFTSKPYYEGGSARSFRGHKGVGLTFLAFGTDYFRFNTKRETTSFVGALRDGNAWVRNENGEVAEPKVQPCEFSPEFLDG